MVLSVFIRPSIHTLLLYFFLHLKNQNNVVYCFKLNLRSSSSTREWDVASEKENVFKNVFFSCEWFCFKSLKWREAAGWEWLKSKLVYCFVGWSHPTGRNGKRWAFSAARIIMRLRPAGEARMDKSLNSTASILQL